jgi:hypothetical protein
MDGLAEANPCPSNSVEPFGMTLRFREVRRPSVVHQYDTLDPGCTAVRRTFQCGGEAMLVARG